MDRQFIGTLGELIGESTGASTPITGMDEIDGGSISRSFIVRAGHARWFVKLNEADQREMFAAEADGLTALATCPELRVPRVVAQGMIGTQACLILEYVALSPLLDRAHAARAGQALASLHRIEAAHPGWHRGNYIGSTPQANGEEQTWPLFFARRRLHPQLELAKRRGGSARLVALGERLIGKLPALFAGQQTPISLLHGDLWHGNAALDESGRLTLFDPAVYYGDRETDLAMSELFGGFPETFRAAYREAWPLTDGFAQRKTVYNLYHVLNHFNLFGGGYLQQAERMIAALLAEIG